MRALVLQDFDAIELTNIPEPRPSSDEVVMEVGAAVVGDDDLLDMGRSTSRSIPPVVLGRRASGRIAELGRGVTDWKVGDHVTIESYISCKECYYCSRGMMHLCQRREYFGVSSKAYKRQGVFAECVAVPQHTLYRLSPELAFPEAALSATLAEAIHAVEKNQLEFNETVLVIGADLLGLLLVQVLRLTECGKIICLDRNDRKLRRAAGNGADLVLDTSNNDFINTVRNYTGGAGVNRAFCTMADTGDLHDVIGCLSSIGSLTFVGGFAGSPSLPISDYRDKELCFLRTLDSCAEIPAAIDLIVQGKVKTDDLIQTVRFSDAVEYLTRLRTHPHITSKSVLVPD